MSRLTGATMPSWRAVVAAASAGGHLSKVLGLFNLGVLNLFCLQVDNPAFLTVGAIFDIWFTDINGRFNAIM